MQGEAQARNDMNRMYRLTRHVYDATRRYYLPGRDRLIGNLRPAPGQVVCEVGCGTARNLVKMARVYPWAHFSGIDASDEMLKTARANLVRAGLTQTVEIVQGFAQSFTPETPPDRIVFSYALSIIPPWRESIDHALDVLKPGGEIHIVDFGGQKGLPKPFRHFLFWWLGKFHVCHRPEIVRHLRALEVQGQGVFFYTPLYRDYAYYAVFRKTEL